MKQDDNSAITIILVIVGVILLGVYKLSVRIGADFEATLYACFHSVGVIALIGFIWWKIGLGVRGVIAGLLAGLWPCWWQVLDSIATNESKFGDFYLEPLNPPWWNSGWFQFGLEAIFLSFIIYLFLKRHR